MRGIDGRPIRALVVDDESTLAELVSMALRYEGWDIRSADTGTAAVQAAREFRPDVIVLDVEMPRMDGISFLKKLMAERPTAVVMCSTLTERGCETTLQALAAGAVSCVTKPKIGLRDFLSDRSNGLVDAVKAAARANLRVLAPARPAAPASPRVARPAGGPATVQAMAETTDRVVAIGISTGGVGSSPRMPIDPVAPCSRMPFAAASATMPPPTMRKSYRWVSWVTPRT